MTLREQLAAVLGPGNDDATAYAQADSVTWESPVAEPES